MTSVAGRTTAWVRTAAARALTLANPVAAWREGRAAVELVRFWTDGGLEIGHPIPRGDKETLWIRMLLQPSGDMVLSVPPGFGSAPEDAAAAALLIRQSEAAMERNVGAGLTGASDIAVRLVDYGLIAGWTWGGVLAVGTSLDALILAPAFLTAARAVAGRWLRDQAADLGMRWIENEVRRRVGA